MSKSVSPVVRGLFFRTQYDGLNDRVTQETSIVFPPAKDEPFSALQSDRDSCDLNLIVHSANAAAYFERYQDRAQSGAYLDLVDLPDYTDAMNTIAVAREMFMDLPAHIRKEFDNSPAEFLAFIDRGDRAEMERLGLLPKPQPSDFPESNSKVPDGTEDEA